VAEEEKKEEEEEEEGLNFVKDSVTYFVEPKR